MRIFLICSVRNASEEERAAQLNYVEGLETAGHKVHWPPRNTNQNDPIGLRICEDNLKAMQEGDKVFVWYSGTSEGSMFDGGMARALGKRMVYVNTEVDWFGILVSDSDIKKMADAEEIHIRWQKNSKKLLALFGVAFALGKKIILENPEEVQPTPHKSFENVLLALAGNRK